MKINFTVTQKTELATTVVAALDPKVDVPEGTTPREGDDVSINQLFITTSKENMTLNYGDVVSLEISDPIPPEGTV